MTTILRGRSAVARTWIPAVAGVAAAAFAVAGCGGSSGSHHASAYGAPAPTSPASSPGAYGKAPVANSTGGASIQLASSNLGKILVDSKGNTLYLWQADKGTASTCHG